MRGTWRIVLSRRSARPIHERRAQSQVLLNVQRLCSQVAVSPHLSQFAINIFLGPAAARRAGQCAAQVLAAVDVKIAQEAAESSYVADVGAFGGIRLDENKRGRYLRPGPKYRGRQ